MEKHTDQVLGVSRVGMAFGQEVEELLDVSVEGGDGARSNEAVDVHIAVHAVPELPGVSTDINGVELATDRADASIAGEPKGRDRLSAKRTLLHKYSIEEISPDHQLIVTTVGSVVLVSCSEEIIGNIGVDIAIVVFPFGGGFDARKLANKLYVKLHARVWEGLDRAVGAGPGPLGMPGNTAVGDAVNGGALRAAARVLSPHVVVDGVDTFVVAAILITELLSGGSSGKSEDQSGLHCGIEMAGLLGLVVLELIV